jgi:GT2 family glycosyltransferase
MPRVKGTPSAGRDGAPIVVAVVSWNTRDLLDHCLRSLKPAADSGLAEVWVVDNASTDGSADMVRSSHPWVELVASDHNHGYGPGIKLVAERTASPWLVASNADIAVHEGALERLLEASRRDAGAGIIAPRLILPDGSTQHSVWPFPELLPMALANLGPRATPRRIGERFALHDQWDPGRPRRVPWALGAFLLIRREAWDEVGGFDADQWMSAEDLDLGWRMREAGWATRYEPAALVDHAESAAVTQMWGARLPIHWQRCAYAWMVRRRGRRAAAGVGVVNFAGSLARLALYAVLCAVRPARWRARVRAQAEWTLVHAYAFAPRKTLDAYR